jgi:AraC family transcriptional regulator
MESRFETMQEKKLIGKRMRMSLLDNKTPNLWKSFMVDKHQIKNAVNTDLYSMQIYDTDYFLNFNPGKEFVKYAMVEVENFEEIPNGMEAFTLQKGLYVVFTYRGPASGGGKAFQYIFQEWMPSSEYSIDNRPHFELLGVNYKNEDPDSEEEIWIPIKKNV